MYTKIGYLQWKITVTEFVNVFTLTDNYLVHTVRKTDIFWYH